MMPNEIRKEAKCMECAGWHMLSGATSLAPLIILCRNCEKFTPHDADNVRDHLGHTPVEDNDDGGSGGYKCIDCGRVMMFNEEEHD